MRDNLNLVDGDATKILTTRYEVRDEPGTAQAMPRVENLTATTGDEPGKLNLHRDSVENAQSYAAQIGSDDAPVKTAWQYAPPVGHKSRNAFCLIRCSALSTINGGAL